MIGIILLGVSNSGKSTIAKEIIRYYSVNRTRKNRPIPVYISSGDIARKLDSSIIETGEMANEILMREEIFKAISKAREESIFILDGFPRTVEQYEWINKNINGSEDIMYIEVAVSDSEAIRRANARGRADDHTIIQKLKKQREALNDIKFVIKRDERTDNNKHRADKSKYEYRIFSINNSNKQDLANSLRSLLDIIDREVKEWK